MPDEEVPQPQAQSLSPASELGALPFHRHTGVDSPQVNYNDLFNKPGATWKTIEEKTLTADTHPVTFSSIPTTYRFLRLTAWFGRATSNGAVGLEFNDDEGLNYDWSHSQLRGGAFTANSSHASNSASPEILFTDLFGDLGLSFQLIISQPSATQRKSWYGTAHPGNNTSVTFGGWWENLTSRITKIEIEDQSGLSRAFLNGSVFILEGLA